MTTILVNEVEQTADSSLKTWGELLDRLESRVVPSGHVVTAVRFDGVDEPTFRNAAVMCRGLSDVAVLEVDSGSVAEVIGTAVSEAARALDALRPAITQVAHRFIGQDLATANRELVALAQSLRMFISLVATAAMGLGIDLQTIDAGPVDDMSGRLAEHIDTLIAAQESEDWVTLADTLQYDIEPALEEWRPILTVLQRAAGDGARAVAVPG